MYLVYYEDYTVPHTFFASEEITNTELNMEGAGQVPELKYMTMNRAASATGFEVMALRQVVTPTSLWQASCQSCITRKVRAKLVVTTKWAMDLSLMMWIVGNTALLSGWKFLLKQLEIQESTSLPEIK